MHVTLKIYAHLVQTHPLFNKFEQRSHRGLFIRLFLLLFVSFFVSLLLLSPLTKQSYYTDTVQQAFVIR